MASRDWSSAAARAVLCSLSSLFVLGGECAQAQWADLRKQDVPSHISGSWALLLDVDIDGDLDILANDFSPPVSLRWLANDGTGRFQLVSLGTTAWSSVEPERGDTDGDGDADAVLDSGVLLSQPGGPVFVPFAFGSPVIACADFTGDGRADVLCRTGLWLSLPNGSFALQSSPTAPLTTADAADADLDGDGDLDLVLVQTSAGERAWRNDGLGNFTDVSSLWLPTPSMPEGIVVAAGDLDGDGDADVAIGSGPTTRGWRFRRNDGTGVLQPWFSAAGAYEGDLGHDLADLDGDGDLDVPGISAWLRNDGPGVLQALPLSPSGANLGDVGDVDGDGRPDIVGSGCLLLNRLPAQFVDATRGACGLPMPTLNARLSAGDVDSDGDLDFLRGGQLLVNDGSGWTEPMPTTWGPNFVGRLVADVDGDGDQDVVGHGLAAPSISVQHNLGGGLWAAGATTFVSGDLLLDFDADADGDPDLLLAGMRILRNDGTGTFTPDAAGLPAGASCTAATAADFDGDGDPDLLGAADRFHMYVNDGAGNLTWTPSRLGVFSGSLLPLDLVPFDAEGDGDLDVFVCQSEFAIAPYYHLLQNTGGGTLVVTSNLLPLLRPSGFGRAGDVDGDGDSDLLVRTAIGLNQWNNDGLGTFSDAGSLAPMFVPAEELLLVDVDADDDLDIVVGDHVFANRQWHAAAPFLAVPRRDYVVELGSTRMPNCIAVPFLGLRARLPVPPYGTIGLDLRSVVPLNLVTLSGGVGSLSIPIPAGAALVGVQFGVQAILMDSTGIHLTPTVYDTVH